MNKKIKNLLKENSNWILQIIIILVTITLFFIFSLKYINAPTGWRNNLGGTHSWLTGSTIKFTNNWLKDGIMNDKFTMLEAPSSIELPTLESREQYVSYPPGTILTTYTAAKLVGKEEVGFNFIKLINIAFYLLDALLIGLIIYVILEWILKIKSRNTKTILPIILSCLWIMLPNNIYYLRNIFFADQLVLFFINLLILLELLKNYIGIKNKKILLVINIILILTIIMGVLIDYYFWIQLFIIGLINLVYLIIKHEKFLTIIKKLSLYVIPALISVFLYFIQLSTIPNWYERLVNKAEYRLNLVPTNLDYWQMIVSNIKVTYSNFGLIIFYVLAAIILLLYLIRVYNKKSYRNNKETFTKILKISTIIILPAFIQILVLKNHSAIHEFSLLKLGLPLVFGFILIVYILSILFNINSNSTINIHSDDENAKKQISLYPILVIILIVVFLSFSNMGNRISEYFNKRYDVSNYEMATLIKESTEFEHVLFSYTEEQLSNPPVAVAISNKKIYKINELSDIENKFPDLDKNAILVFVINKKIEKDENTIEKEKYLQENYEILDESTNYILLK